MRASDIRARPAPQALRYSLVDSPHGTIESNRDCNMTCRLCYNRERWPGKPLEKIGEEISALMARRNLSVVTILGGEPTLHPHLPEIVRQVKRRRLICQLLTNGKAFFEPHGIELLDRLAAAGIDKILLHIDSGQGWSPAELQARRAAAFSMMEARRIRFSLALTLYNEDEGAIARAIRRYSGFRFFDGILAVLARDTEPGGEQKVQMADICRQVDSALGVPPVAFVPSSRADDEVCWLIYMLFINCRSGGAAALPVRLNRLFRAGYRFIHGRNFFVISGSPGWTTFQFLATAILAALLSPASLPGLMRLLRRSAWLRHIRLHYIAIQEPPLFDEAENLIRICRHCPDATMRNGRLTPICIADAINPMAEHPEPVRRDWQRLTYAHLGEAE